MCGRKDQDAQRKQKIEQLLEDRPEVLNEYIISMRDTLPATKLTYLTHVLEFIDFLKENGKDEINFKSIDIDKFIEHLQDKNKVASINLKLSAIKSYCGFLADNEYIEKNPAAHQKKVKERRGEDDYDEHSIVVLAEDEVNQVKENIKNRRCTAHITRDLAIFQIGISMGLRVSEIRNIDVEDIDLENQLIHNIIQKGGKRRAALPFGDNTKKALEDWLKDRKIQVTNPNEHALFVSQTGQRISVRAIETMITNEGNKIGRRISPHKMRSTCGTLILNKTEGNMELAAAVLGHSNSAITRKYYATWNLDTLRSVASLAD